MGKGDKKTKRGKLFQGSYGNRRPRKVSRKYQIPAAPKNNPEPPSTEKHVKKEVPVSEPIAEKVIVKKEKPVEKEKVEVPSQSLTKVQTKKKKEGVKSKPKAATSAKKIVKPKTGE